MKRCRCSFSPYSRKAICYKTNTRQFKPKQKVAKISFLSSLRKKQDRPIGLSCFFFCLRMDLNSMRRFAKQTAGSWSPSAPKWRRNEGDKGENKERTACATAYKPTATIFSSGHFNSLLLRQNERTPRSAFHKAGFTCCAKQIRRGVL